MSNMIKFFGGRKSFTFLVTLMIVACLAVFDKASTEILGLIDTLYLVYAGANVAAKKKDNTK
jgi:nitrate/nitrite transporter NarK